MTPITVPASTRFSWTAARSWLWVPILLTGGNAILWTVYTAMGGSLVSHHDSLEAYAWGREFQFGYYKHPPFWAWLAGLWFRVFPHTDWAFILLSECNASLGILGTWALLGRFTKGPERLAGTLLLLLTTFYSFNAFRFNANTIQLSLWPWTMYFFVISMEKKTAASGVAFGILAGLALLSKYYTALLLCSCLIAALIHRDRRAYFRSAAPWSAIAVCSLVGTPHLIWAIHHNYQPVLYALGKKGRPDAKYVDTWIGFFTICALFHALQAAVVGAVKLGGPARNAAESGPLSIKHGRAFLAVLALAPLALTLMAGLVGYRVTPLYVVPIFSLTPFLLLIMTGADAKRVTRATMWTYGTIVAACLAIAPVVPSLAARFGESFEPYQEISNRAADEWQSTTSAPLRIVSGSWPYSAALAFYIDADASEFTQFNFDWAPWITPRRLKRRGLLAVCLKSDETCFANASRFATPQTRIVETEVAASHGRPRSSSMLPFTIFVTPPRNDTQ